MIRFFEQFRRTPAIYQQLYTVPSKFIRLQVGHELVNDILHRPVEGDVVQRMGLVDGHFALRHNEDQCRNMATKLRRSHLCKKYYCIAAKNNVKCVFTQCKTGAVFI